MPASLADSGRGLAARISRIPGNAVADLTISHRIAALKNIKDNETCNMFDFCSHGLLSRSSNSSSSTYQVSLFEFLRHLSCLLGCRTLRS